MMNYHEMTMNEPRNSPARRQQYLIICTVMAVAFLHSVITAGGVSTIDIREGIFPGGDFVYRLSQRDYAAAYGLIEDVGTHYNITPGNYVDLVYTLYLDNPFLQGGPDQRFGTGILVDGSKEGKALKQKFLHDNAAIAKMSPWGQKEDPTPLAKFQREPWKHVSLPSVDAAVVQFPGTNGFVSLLITSYRIIPALRKYAAERGEKGNVPVVISTCSPRQYMCTHYAPLVQGKKFLLGQEDSQTFAASAPYHLSVNWGGVVKDLRSYLPF